GHLDGVERFGQRSNLVELDQDRVGYTAVDTFFQNTRVGDEQIVADELDLAADLLGEVGPAIPVAFIHTVFDGEDRIFGGESRQVIGKLRRTEYLALAGQIVFAVLVELARRAIECEGDVLADL